MQAPFPHKGETVLCLSVCLHFPFLRHCSPSPRSPPSFLFPILHFFLCLPINQIRTSQRSRRVKGRQSSQTLAPVLKTDSAGTSCLRQSPQLNIPPDPRAPLARAGRAGTPPPGRAPRKGGPVPYHELDGRHVNQSWNFCNPYIWRSSSKNKQHTDFPIATRLLSAAPRALLSLGRTSLWTLPAVGSRKQKEETNTATGVSLKGPRRHAELALSAAVSKRGKSGAKTKTRSKTTITPRNPRHKPSDLIRQLCLFLPFPRSPDTYNAMILCKNRNPY